MNICPRRRQLRNTLAIVAIIGAGVVSPLAALGASAEMNKPVVPVSAGRTSAAPQAPPVTTGLACDLLHKAAGAAFDLSHSTTSVAGKSPDEWLEIASYLYVTWLHNCGA